MENLYRPAIARSYGKRLKEFVKAAAADPSLLHANYVLPPDYEIMTETAEVFTKALLLGMEPEAENFADDEPLEILPFEETLAYMNKRLPVDRKTYYELADKMRFRAFTVGRLADGDAVRHVQSMLSKSLEEGHGIQRFLELTEGQLADAAGMGRGSGWYYETVYRTNMSTAYNVGRAIAFEETPPVALELVGIDDARQTEICHSLTVPPFRRPYDDPVWDHLWPPFHFNCRTTVRAIYDPSEIKDAGGPDKFYTRGTPDYKPAKGFGGYPLEKNDSWWDLTDAMKERVTFYGFDKEFEEAKEKLIGSSDNLPDNAKRFVVDEEKVSKTLHEYEMSIKDISDHEEGVIINLDGRFIHKEVSIKYSSIELPLDLVKDNIVTHNHTTGICAFTPGDVCGIIDADGYGIRAVTSDGRFVSLYKGNGELNKSLGREMLKEFPNNNVIFSKAERRAAVKFGRGNYSDKDVDNEAEIMLNEWLKANALKFGYVFKRGLL